MVNKPNVPEGRKIVGAPLRAKLASFARHLPVLPVVARELEALREAHDPTVVERVERLGGIDPTLALRILFLARRRLLPSTRVITLPHLMARVGADAIVEDLRTITDASGSDLPVAAQSLWLHSIQVAIAAKYFANSLSAFGVQGDEAYLCGLLHDAGRFIELAEDPARFQFVEAKRGETADELTRSEASVFGIDHAEIGSVACALWGLPARLATAIGRHHGDAVVPEGIDARTLHLLRIIILADATSFALMDHADLPTYDASSRALAFEQHGVDRAAHALGLTVGAVSITLSALRYKSAALVLELFAPSERHAL